MGSKWLQALGGLVCAAKAREWPAVDQEAWINQTHTELYEEIKSLEKINTELLEALEAMCAEFRGYDLPYGSEAYAKAISAINKSRGVNQ